MLTGLVVDDGGARRRLASLTGLRENPAAAVVLLGEGSDDAHIAALLAALGGTLDAVATVDPVPDTLKVVGPDRTVLATGGRTAREGHRAVRPPVAIRGRALTAVLRTVTDEWLATCTADQLLRAVAECGGRIGAISSAAAPRVPGPRSK